MDVASRLGNAALQDKLLKLAVAWVLLQSFSGLGPFGLVEQVVKGPALHIGLAAEIRKADPMRGAKGANQRHRCGRRKGATTAENETA